MGVRRNGRLGLTVAAVVIAGAGVVAAAAPAVAVHHQTPGVQSAGSVLGTSTFSNDFEAAPYTGNGYLSQRVPAAGMGFLGDLGTDGWPLYDTRTDGALVAGLFATTSGMQRIAQVPTWSTLDFSSPSGTYSPATATASNVSQYSQRLDPHTGVVSTSGVWTAPGGERTRFSYQLFADRGQEHVGVVRLTLTPQWSGTAQVSSLLDGNGAAGLTPVDGGFDTATAQAYMTDTTQGLGTGVTEAGTLTHSANVTITGTDDISDVSASTAGGQLSFPVSSGQTYQLTKYVAIYTGTGTETTARDASLAAAQAGWDRLATEDDATWASLWGASGDPIEVTGDPSLQNVVNASEYDLWASVNPSSPDSIGPSGLSSDNYGGLVFWDADTWMSPALLAQDPELAKPIVSYRDRTLAAAEANAKSLGYQGAFYPWTSGSDGVYATNCYGGSCSEEIHLQSDIALAQWQYYQATGDKQWLRNDGWPVIQALAQFWAGRATAGTDGGYSIDNIQPPDEYVSGVSNDPYTNVGAAQTLDIATKAAAIVGQSAPASWADIAKGLIASLPFDQADGVYDEYDGYTGQTVKQADVTMLTYPLRFSMPPSTALADLNYYGSRTDLGGPAMTQAINSIDSSLLGQAGCSSYTYLVQSYQPFLHGPFDQLAELFPPGSISQAPGGEDLSEPAFNFLTGVGGFLQEFLYGFSGLELGTSQVSVDPSLPAQLPGLVLRGVRWQGRTLRIAIGHDGTTVTLESGSAMTLDFAGRAVSLRPGASVTGPTRSPSSDNPDGNLALCHPTSASSSAVYSTPDGATDGSDATNWTAGSAQASLTVNLGGRQTVREVVVTRGTSQPFSYDVQLSSDGRHWTTVRPVPAASGGTDVVPVPATTARYVRLSFPGGSQMAVPVINEVGVYGAAHLTALQVSGGNWLAPIGSSAELTTTLTNVGSATVRDARTSLSGPPGWTATPVTPATSSSLAPGHSLVTTWQVSVPAAATAGSYPLTATASATGTRTQTTNESIQAVDVCSTGQACQAEDGTVQGQASVANNQSGYTGTGFVAIEHPGDGVVVYVDVPTAGTYQLETRYANYIGGAEPPYVAETRTASVSVNGSLTGTLSMPVTGSWSTWDTVSTPVQLNAGVNAVGLYCAAADNCAVNIDAFTAG